MRSVLFVDDHPIYRDAVRRTLELEIEGLRVATAENCGAALALLADREVDLCLADYRLPDGDGLSLLKQVRARHPLIAVGLLCADLSPALADGAAALGAVLCLSKDKTSADLVAAISIAFAGGRVYDAAGAGADSNALSLRRREILIHASQGLLDKQISELMGVSESTIRAHWARIFEQLQVGNRTEAVTRALRQRLI
ncbi:putative two-component transcriptional regulator, LuxR family [Bradyrhizobium sp. ORS 285]|uniref:response regulator transcription factor n=1 Tax=Bradyrhizobium sp. ORS 285 TaxID=115808 RepID=UPI0002409583|nr:response regulator transcription factor [Bradyrhizobium sp. ORS 285]CCD89256.1 putative two-component transcriptional regulator, LuxR family [Bradyrhizobium sp. ORS 285]SMX56117.1 putative two-component transcriptional regulator, LuxR family [Bradyrhizobium sp. ORS 285]